MNVVILIDEMYEDSEFIYPYYRLLEAGCHVDVASRHAATVTGKHGTSFHAAKVASALDAAAYDAVYIPGGYAPDKLRRDPAVLHFVKAMYDAGKPVCAICHAPWVLISAGVARGSRVTGFGSIKDDLVNAGALYTGHAVEEDGNLITAQDPAAMPEMMRRLTARLAER